MEKLRKYLPRAGWPIYDLRRRKFGIVTQEITDARLEFVYAHIEGDRFPVRVEAYDTIYQYPRFYDNDEVLFNNESYFIKHTHYHVPKNVWEYTLMKRGSFDRIIVEGHSEFQLINPFISPT